MPDSSKKNQKEHILTTSRQESPRQIALGYILEAWDEAVINGVEPHILANAALYAALCDLVATYGEEHVIKLTNGLAERIEHGEFTIYRTTQ